jgi:hypothetical protein
VAKLNFREGQGKNGDVIFLAEALRGFRDVLGCRPFRLIFGLEKTTDLTTVGSSA